MSDAIETQTPPDQQLVITRIFDAPRDRIWQALTEPQHLAHWWGPKGSTITVLDLDLRPEGVFHYCMTAPDGSEMWGIFRYLSIQPPERLEFVNGFADADGNLVRAPFPGLVWPLEVHNVWTLAEADGKTTFTLRGGPINATEEERRSFAAMHASMNQGFNGTFDQLDEYLPKMAA